MLKAILKLVLAVVLLLFLLWLPLWYMAKPINEYCDGITNETSHETIISNAKALNYRVYDKVKNGDGELFVETGSNHYFQLACHISFKQGKIINKQVQNSD